MADHCTTTNAEKPDVDAVSERFGGCDKVVQFAMVFAAIDTHACRCTAALCAFDCDARIYWIGDANGCMLRGCNICLACDRNG